MSGPVRFAPALLGVCGAVFAAAAAWTLIDPAVALGTVGLAVDPRPWRWLWFGYRLRPTPSVWE